VPVGRGKFSQAGIVEVTSGCPVGETKASQAGYCVETPPTVAVEHGDITPGEFFFICPLIVVFE